MEKDVWKPIKGFDGYSINKRNGDILSKKILKPRSNKGYKAVILVDNEGNQKYKYIHKLYQETFKKPLP